MNTANASKQYPPRIETPLDILRLMKARPYNNFLWFADEYKGWQGYSTYTAIPYADFEEVTAGGLLGNKNPISCSWLYGPYQASRIAAENPEEPVVILELDMTSIWNTSTQAILPTVEWCRDIPYVGTAAKSSIIQGDNQTGKLLRNLAYQYNDVVKEASEIPEADRQQRIANYAGLSLSMGGFDFAGWISASCINRAAIIEQPDDLTALQIAAAVEPGIPNSVTYGTRLFALTQYLFGIPIPEWKAANDRARRIARTWFGLEWNHRVKVVDVNPHVQEPIYLHHWFVD
jgi:hypothetical protein